VRIVLLSIVLLGLACRSRPAAPAVTDGAEVARLRAEQAELKARIAALEQRAASVAGSAPPATSPPTAPSPAPAPSLPAPLIPAPSPAAKTGPLAAANPGLAAEDLHGLPRSPSPSPSPSGSSGVLGLPEAQGKPLLDDLNRQLELFKAKQAEQQAALDELEKMY
jgi:hypothetical protein